MGLCSRGRISPLYTAMKGRVLVLVLWLLGGVLGWSRQPFHSYYNWEESSGGDTYQAEEASGEGEVIDNDQLDFEISSRNILQEEKSEENMTHTERDIESENFIKVDVHRNKHKGATINIELSNHEGMEVNNKLKEYVHNYEVFNNHEEIRESGTVKEYFDASQVDKNFAPEDALMIFSDNSVSSSPLYDSTSQVSTTAEPFINISIPVTEEYTSQTGIELQRENSTKERDDEAAKENVYWKENEERKVNVIEKPKKELYDVNYYNSKQKYNLIEEKAVPTENIKETTTLPSTPPPLCITRSGDRKAPYVFSLSPLPPRSHVQYTFITMDMGGEESYQNIALTIRGSRGKGRGGTQFLHTRGGRRGVVTLGPGNTGLFVRVQSNTHTGQWTFTGCVLNR